MCICINGTNLIYFPSNSLFFFSSHLAELQWLMPIYLTIRPVPYIVRLKVIVFLASQIGIYEFSCMQILFNKCTTVVKFHLLVGIKTPFSMEHVFNISNKKWQDCSFNTSLGGEKKILTNIPFQHYYNHYRVNLFF